MDGTLTQAVHDFPSIHRVLNASPQTDILPRIAALSETEITLKRAWLLEHQYEYDSQGMAIRSIASKIGCTAQTLRLGAVRPGEIRVSDLD